MAKIYNNVSEIEDLVSQFSSLNLPAGEFTHEAHLTVALYYVFNYSVEGATCYLRSGIITYNRSVGNENTPDKGYHESITLFWIKIISNYLVIKSEDLLEVCNGFLASPCSSREYPFEFYSKGRLLSPEARAFWIEPDLQALPGVSR